MKKIVCLLLSISLCSIAFAHDEPDPHPTAWKKCAGLGLNLTDGNSEATSLSVGLGADREKDGEIWHFAFDFNYGEQTNSEGVEDTTVERYIGDATYQHLLSERLYAGGGLNFPGDAVSEVEYRVNTFATLGYFYVKQDNFDAYVEVGPGYIFEEVDEIDNDYFAPRVSEGFDWKISETSRLFHNASVAFDIDDSDNYLVTAELGIEGAITDTVTISTTITDIYDNQPAVDFERNDIQIVTSLNYLF